MPILFHQNMRRFGGGTAPRNNAYNGVAGGGAGAFAGILAGLGAGVGPVAVAGFTEIMNDGATNAALTASCASLGMAGGAGPGFIGNIACGQTALANGPEYIGIASSYPVLTIGRMLIQVHQGVSLIHQRDTTAAGLNNQAMQGATADYRGLVYAVVASPAGNIAVGFLHNLYTFVDQRSIVMGQVPNMMANMGGAASGHPPIGGIVACYIGGDFNVGMISPRHQAIGYYANAPAATYPAGSAGTGTTYSGNGYDYWYSDIDPAAAPPAGLIVPVPSADASTMDSGPGVAGLMSDHAATMLQII